MKLYFFSDESGVLDKKHNKYFVYGGIVLFSAEDKAIQERKYLHVEQCTRISEGIHDTTKELKASSLSNNAKGKIFRSLNNIEKFGICIEQRYVLDQIFENKKSKQRFLDWAYKMAVKKKLQELISNRKIVPEEIEELIFFIDEHTTATNGRYELQESLEQEFKIGVFTSGYTSYAEPILPNIKKVTVHYCNSEKVTLIRAADIIANKLYYLSEKQKLSELKDNFKCIIFPGLHDA